MTGQSEGGVPLMILAGGRGSRLNGDKALMPFAGATLLDAVLNRVRSDDRARLIALNANGNPTRFDRFRLPVLADPIPDHPGPLAGILAAMEWAAGLPHRHAVRVGTVPTDTPFLPENLLDRLEAAADDAPETAIICAETARGLHPVVALWPVCLRDALRDAILRQGVRRVGDFVSRYPLRRVMVADEGFDPLMNINTAAELAAAEALVLLGHRVSTAG